MNWGKRKYGNTKVDFHGRSFASKLEAAVYGVLLLREKSGELTEIKCQVHTKFHTFAHGNIIMIPDFCVTMAETHEVRFIEAKGMFTREWARKKKAWAVNGPGTLEIWGGHYSRPKLIETIIPKEKTKQEK